ncbi:HK97 gp10 family phage protein [Blautia producta]|nr:HK97 gp10 family phage protein [Blautia producta]NSG17422.1 HK97 gp10 family phage protein [Blautia producta]NSJ77598.1 HK97 gp10 family phage protein [Blautia producta]
MSKVNIDGLEDAVLKELKKFNNVTEEEFEKIAKAVAKEGTKKLKATSPRGRGSKKGHYADGWGVTYFRKGNGKFQFVVHNKKKPGLTHLLENGHALNIGGRARAIVHIKPVEEWCNEEFERRVEMRLGR